MKRRENDPSGPKEALYNWYPGHMAKALREVKQKLELIDVILEIRDARAPNISSHFELDEKIQTKSRLIILNKSDLADPEMIKKWSQWFLKNNFKFIFVNSQDKASVRKISSMVREMVNPELMAPNSKIKLMIVGLPNTGKSTVINILANKNITKVADKPGQTVIQQWVLIEKDMELLDTPGIMPPKIENPEHAFWLSSIHALPDHIAGEDDTAIFLIRHFLKTQNKKFLERYKLDSFELSVEEVLNKISILRGCLLSKGKPDYDRVYKIILHEFRNGELGRTSFGHPPID
jgi:ribosome biogenesis GTPase A